MKVLVLCEYSGIVRDAFLKDGHDALSCDLLPTESEGPHYQGDAFELLAYKNQWDLIIAHPPCTAICVAGNRTYGKGKPKHYKRLLSLSWTKKLWDRCRFAGRHICFENPVGVLGTVLGKATQYIQPYEHGHMEQKKTGLWLHDLPELEPTNSVYDNMMLLTKKERERIFYMSPGPNRGKERSKFYTGIANAMAEQWGCL